MLLTDGDGKGIVTIVSVGGVGVNGGFVDALGQKVERKVEVARGFVGDATQVPVGCGAVLSSDGVVLTNFAGERESDLEIIGDGANKLEHFGKTLFVNIGAVGSHDHAGIDGDKIG